MNIVKLNSNHILGVRSLFEVSHIYMDSIYDTPKYNHWKNDKYLKRNDLL